MQAMEDVDFVGRTVDHYAIVALIRGGAQGRVYRARDQRLKRDVAIKVLQPDRAGPAPPRQALIAEARTLSRLNHPHVAAVYDFVTHGERDFMVMEFVAGATLQDVLAGGPLPMWEVARLGSQLARGLAAAHAANIVHCDIKPTNLKVTSAGLLKILDFGVAKQLPSAALRDDTTTATSQSAAGTVPYMSPEVLSGERADERSDIYGAGAVLYEMATGCRAFPQRTLPRLIDAIQDGDVAAPSAIDPVVPVALERVITTAMRVAPEARYQSAIAMATAIEALMSNGERHAATSRTSVAWWPFTNSRRSANAQSEIRPLYLDYTDLASSKR